MDENLLHKIKAASVVSLDIFDTAVLRAVYKPTDLFRFVTEKYVKESGPLDFDFHNIRIEAERKAREKVWREKGQTEILFDDIYYFIENNYKIESAVLNQLKSIELFLEEKFSFRNPFIYDLCQYCIESGKRIVFTSDIYLPEETVRKILHNSGYGNFAKLYLSSACLITKATGELYDYILRDLQVLPREILHIGDNYDSDIRAAGIRGLGAYYYEKCRDQAENDKDYRKKILGALGDSVGNIEYSLYNSAIVNKYYCFRGDSPAGAETNFWYDTGYTIIGMLYLCFADWLLKQSRRDGIPRLYFLARDGFIMKAVYDKLRQYQPEAPEAAYVYASRRALNIPFIRNLGEKHIDFLVSGTSRLSVGQFLERIGLIPGDHEEAIGRAGFSGSRDKVITGLDYGRLRKLFRLLAGRIEEKAKEEREILTEYLEETGLLKEDRAAIVDIGWHGSMQRSLSGLLAELGRNPDLKGYYLATFPPAREIADEGHQMSSFLCSCGSPQKYHDIIKQCVEIFEFVHSAPHGSVLRFSKNSDTIKPLLDDDVQEDKRDKVRSLQDGALDFIDDFLKGWQHVSFLPLSRDLAVSPISRLLENPDRTEAVHFGDLEHAEGFGDVYEKRYIARPPSLKTLVFKPHMLIYEYRRSFWKKGYWKRFFPFADRL